MKKLCIYVEGQTEELFVEKLITEIANKNEIAIIIKKLSGGGKNSGTEKSLTIIRDTEINEKTKYYIQIINCQNDERVQSEIRENWLSMQKSGFEKVLGIRDLYPKKLEDLAKILKYMHIKDPNLKIIAKSIIAVFEIETWFLAEYNFFKKLDSRLTLEYIKNNGYDLENDKLDMDIKYHHSADILNQIYHLVGRSYDKTLVKSQFLVENLDYEKIYLELQDKLKSLKEFISELDDFFDK